MEHIICVFFPELFILCSYEEAKKRMYAFSTTTYVGFQAVMTEEMSEKFRGEWNCSYIYVLLATIQDPSLKGTFLLCHLHQDCLELYSYYLIHIFIQRQRSMEVCLILCFVFPNSLFWFTNFIGPLIIFVLVYWFHQETNMKMV